MFGSRTCLPWPGRHRHREVLWEHSRRELGQVRSLTPALFFKSLAMNLLPDSLPFGNTPVGGPFLCEHPDSGLAWEHCLLTFEAVTDSCYSQSLGDLTVPSWGFFLPALTQVPFFNYLCLNIRIFLLLQTSPIANTSSFLFLTQNRNRWHYSGDLTFIHKVCHWPKLRFLR